MTCARLFAIARPCTSISFAMRRRSTCRWRTRLCRNGSYTIEERLARWLLMCHDRVDGDDLPLVHEFLSMMLGVRRSGVTIAVQTLEATGMIKATRGHINVRDRAKLEEAAAGSYGVPEAGDRRSAGRSDLTLRLPERERPRLLKTTLFAMGALAGCASQHIWSAAQHARPDRQNGEGRPGPEARAADPPPAN